MVGSWLRRTHQADRAAALRHVPMHDAEFSAHRAQYPTHARTLARMHARSVRIRADCGELYGTRRPARKTNVTGHIKNIATTAMGFVFFDSTAISLYSVWGIALGLVGSVLYSISKLRNT